MKTTTYQVTASGQTSLEFKRLKRAVLKAMELQESGVKDVCLYKCSDLGLLENICIKPLEYARSPTKWELRFGEGAIHYGTFSPLEYLKPNGDVKRRLVGFWDGLVYTRN